MMRLFNSWKGAVIVNGTEYASIMDVPSIEGTFHITLKADKSNPEKKPQGTATIEKSADEQEYRITVKKYMTEKANPRFDFMAKWNKDVPMPFRTMTGVKVKETAGMVFMKLHGDIWAEKISTCMCCGRPLTNPVSQYFGIGPECGHHNYINPFETKEELQQAVAAYKKTLVNVTWEGWIIKSAITEEVAL